MSIIGDPLLLGGGGSGGSVVVWDEPDVHGGTIRHIEAASVYEDGDEMGYGSAGLAGTTWCFNETLDFSSGIEINNGRLNFTSNNTNFTSISIMLPYFVLYGRDMVYLVGWENAAYRTITITGGDDAADPDLIAWIQANATEVTA